jgi:glutamate-ammonia-ligase adenylyltransferase
MGFRDPSHVAGAIRGWHHGRIRATRSARARELLTRLMPALLDALAATPDADAAFAQFDRFLSKLPAGVQLFSLFLAHPQLLDLVAAIAGSAPRLSDHMARAPATLDALLDPDFLSAVPTRGDLDRTLAQSFAAARDFEGALDGARRFAREQIFRIGAQLIQDRVTAEDAGPAFTRIAESVIAGLLGVVADELALSAGIVAGGEFCVIAMGKLGGREMTAGSDLDLIFVYDAPSAVEASNGAKPIAVSTYYARLAQRFIAALTAATAEGTLYEVDMRLRPSGNKGPVAVSLEAFRRYQANDAWTWERLALTRARVVAGPEALAAHVGQAIAAALTAKRPGTDILKDAREMRERLAQQFPGRSRWDLKFAPGGLVDIEFVAQALQLVHAASRPELLKTNTGAALTALQTAGILDREQAAILVHAASLQQALTQILKIAVDTTLDPETASEGLKALLLRAAGLPDFALLEGELIRAQKAVRAVFDGIIPPL